MDWFHREIQLPPFPRGFHLITDQVVRATPEISALEIGLLHVFMAHTSASLSLNENADSEVRKDFKQWLDTIVSEDFPFRHTAEGPDDMPAHAKAILLGSSLSIPIYRGKLCLGIWQGIYLGEHRDDGGNRRLVLTLNGKKA